MAVEFLLNSFWNSDPFLARRLEREIEAAAHRVMPPAKRLSCRILPWGASRVSIQFDLPGWVKVLSVAVEARPGEVEQATEEALRLSFEIVRWQTVCSDEESTASRDLA